MGSTWSNEHQQYSMILLYNLENIFDHIATHNAWVMDFKISKLYHIWISLSEEFHWHFFFNVFPSLHEISKDSIWSQVATVYLLSGKTTRWICGVVLQLFGIPPEAECYLFLMTVPLLPNQHFPSSPIKTNTHHIFGCESASVAWYCDTTCIAIPMI